MPTNPILGKRFGNITPRGLTVAETFELNTSKRARVEVTEEKDEEKTEYEPLPAQLSKNFDEKLRDYKQEDYSYTGPTQLTIPVAPKSKLELRMQLKDD